MHLIISSGFGDVRAYEATIANAKEILSWQAVPSDVVALSSSSLPNHYTTYDVIAKVVRKLLEADEGDIVFKSTVDASRTIVATQDAKQELVMYCFNKHIAPMNASAYVIESTFDIKELQCLSLFHDTPLIDKWLAEQADKYATITHDRWKDTATDIGKVRYIINLVNEFSHRDDQYRVIEVEQAC